MNVHIRFDEDYLNNQLTMLENRLVRHYAGGAGIDEPQVREAFRSARRQLDHSRLPAFLPILIERLVRQQLTAPEPYDPSGALADPAREGDAPSSSRTSLTARRRRRRHRRTARATGGDRSGR